MRRYLHILTLSLVSATALWAQRVPEIDELIRLERPGSVAISPDGRSVVYSVQTTNWQEDRYETQLWLARENEQPFQLTRGRRSSTSPEWAPDGRWLSFLSDRSGKNQLYRIWPEGGEAEQLTELEEGVGAFNISPDATWIALAIREAESEELKERKEEYGEFEWHDQQYRRTHLWRFDIDSREKRALTSGDAFTVDSFSISPDGSAIAFSARPFPSPEAFTDSDLYTVNVKDRQVVRIVDWPGSDSDPHWSPDGRSIAFSTSGGEVSYYKNSEIGIVSAAGGAIRLISEAFDEDAGLESWRNDGIYFSAAQKTERKLFRIGPEGDALQLVTPVSGAVLSGFSLARDADVMAFNQTSFGRFNEVYRSALNRFRPERLTHFDDQLKGLQLSTRAVIRWRSKDGTEIEGVLLKPADFDPSRKHPLLCKIHGGPTGVDNQSKLSGSELRYYALERFVARGALVLMVNYRGSAGYGEKFRSLNVRNLGVGDEWDVVSGLDYLIEKGWVDPERVGTMGWSQGGYISAFLATHSDRFKAASVGAGISDWVTYYVNTDIHPFTRQYLKADPWEDPEIYARTSPMTYITHASTPTLIQHGENDARVPIPNAFKLYQGLRDRGVPVRFAIYKDYGHGITRPKSNRAVMKHNEEWFLKWIWGEDYAVPR